MNWFSDLLLDFNTASNCCSYKNIRTKSLFTMLHSLYVCIYIVTSFIWISFAHFLPKVFQCELPNDGDTMPPLKPFLWWSYFAIVCKSSDWHIVPLSLSRKKVILVSLLNMHTASELSVQINSMNQHCWTQIDIL